MIHVIASIAVYSGKLSELLEIYESFVPLVLKEEGCLMYMPTVDVQSGLQRQTIDPKIVTVIEQWEDIAAFKSHINQDHSVKFRADIKGLVESVSFKILKPQSP